MVFFTVERRPWTSLPGTVRRLRSHSSTLRPLYMTTRSDRASPCLRTLASAVLYRLTRSGAFSCILVRLMAAGPALLFVEIMRPGWGPAAEHERRLPIRCGTYPAATAFPAGLGAVCGSP
ncbi:hypothetical protein SFUMM280S_05791 [Streptomyces fumanus]